MTATTRKAPLSGGRLAAVVGGITSLMLAALLLLAGTGLLWADSRKDDDGYFSTSHERLVTSTHAIATDDLEIDGALTLSEGLYGKLRLEVDGDKPVFAGIARSRDVHAYLQDSAHATLTDLEVRPFRPHYRNDPGTLAPGRPGAQTFWAASTEGDGERELTWKVRGRRLVGRGHERRRLTRRQRPRQRRSERAAGRRPRLRLLDRLAGAGAARRDAARRGVQASAAAVIA